MQVIVIELNEEPDNKNPNRCFLGSLRSGLFVLPHINDVLDVILLSQPTQQEKVVERLKASIVRHACPDSLMLLERSERLKLNQSRSVNKKSGWNDEEDGALDNVASDIHLSLG